MNSIIRSNAVETLSQTQNTEINIHNLNSYCDLVSEIAFIYRGHVTLTKEALPEASTNTQTATVTKPQRANRNTGYWSTSLQALLDQLPLTIAHLVTLRSITFFTAIVVWAWTGKIEQVSYIRGKFVALNEPQPLELRHLNKVVNTALKEAQELKTGQVVAELDRKLLVSEVEVQKQHLAGDQMQFNHIKDLMARTRRLAQTLVSVRAKENKDGLGTSAKLEPQNAPNAVKPTERLKQRQIQQLAMGITHLQTTKVQINLNAPVERDFSTSSKISIFPTTKLPATTK
ncbi:MAG: hypothetical protein KME30_20055 [Iphinoe sp. HA4291-MV1]|jgi:hypothetical protein|nr:hypothetical protein [Iphinoe sp. HA4291-MV1]